MKKIALLVCLVVAQWIQAQVTRNLGDFDEVKVFDKINVLLIPSKENKIEATGARADELETVNKNGELKIRMPLTKILAGEDITVKLYFKEIQAVSASEGSTVQSEHDFKQTSLAISANSGSKITLDIDVANATVKSNSGGIVHLSGKASTQDVKITSGGILEARDLNTSQTSINVSAGGQSEIQASVLVNAKVRAGGSIFIYGSPKQINKEVFIGGTILEKK
jgi:hypothetical protein